MKTPAGTLALRIASPTQLLLERPGGAAYAIHPLWLRERCLDAASIDLKTQQRCADPSDFDPELKLLSVSQPAAGIFRVKFSDGHEASFSAADAPRRSGARAQQPRLPGAAALGRHARGAPARALARRRRAMRAARVWLESFLSSAS